MTNFLWDDRHRRNQVEVGSSPDGKFMFLAVLGTGVWTPPIWARRIAAALNEYAARQERGETHRTASEVIADVHDTNTTV